MHFSSAAGWKRLKLLMAAGVLPFILMISYTGIGALQFITSPSELTYQTFHHWGGTGDDFDELRAEIKELTDSDPRIRSVELEIPEAAPVHCGDHASRMTSIIRANALSTEGSDLLDALIRQAGEMGLGSHCGYMSMSITYPEISSNIMLLLYAVLMLAIVSFILLSRHGRRPFWLNWADWQPKTGVAAALRQGALFGVLALLCATAFGALDHYTGWLGGNGNDMENLTNPGLIVLLAIVVAPFVEEYVYRAWLLERLTRVIHTSSALFLSTAAFAVVHFPGSPFDWLNYISTGMVFGVLWLRTRSLVSVIVAHSLYNATIIVLSMLFVD